MRRDSEVLPVPQSRHNFAATRFLRGTEHEAVDVAKFHRVCRGHCGRLVPNGLSLEAAALKATTRRGLQGPAVRLDDRANEIAVILRLAADGKAVLIFAYHPLVFFSVIGIVILRNHPEVCVPTLAIGSRLTISL